MKETKRCPFCGDIMSVRTEGMDFLVQLKTGVDQFAWLECHFCHSMTSINGVYTSHKEPVWDRCNTKGGK